MAYKGVIARVDGLCVMLETFFVLFLTNRPFNLSILQLFLRRTNRLICSSCVSCCDREGRKAPKLPQRPASGTLATVQTAAAV